MTESIRVIDNFLPIEIFQSLAANLMECPGYKCSDFSAAEEEADGSKFHFGEHNPNPNTKLHEHCSTFILFQNDRNPDADLIHNLFHHLKPEMDALYKALNVKKMNILRANCTTAAQENYVSTFHTDFNLHPFGKKMRTAILYLNTNNGGTQLKKDNGEIQFVQSKMNRIVIFPWETYHAGVWCTDKKLRFVLNINYIEN